MSLKLRIACAALLAATALPAFALQLGEIQVKSALNQPLVAAIPLHPKNLTELDGLAVGLASADDFARAGLTLTPTDRTLRFHVVTDNNGQKLILVTSTEPISDPYLDFLVEVNTREGKQLREFVALLNPVIEAPAPAIQEAPVARSPAAQPAAPTPAELPAASAFAQPQPATAPAAQAVKPPPPSPAPVAARQPGPAAHAAAQVEVQRGDTLSGIAREATRGTGVDVNRMMLALQAVNPDAFFRHNINNLKAGAILRMPTQDEIDQRSAVVAAAEVHRQIEAWRAAKPQAATIVAGNAAEAAAGPVPKPESAAPATDHLTLVPPTGSAQAGSGEPGVAGGTGATAGAGASQQLKADRDTLISLNRSNEDLQSRVRDLEAISTKAGKLLSLKDATIAGLQQKLAQTQAAGAGVAGAGAPAARPGAPTSVPGSGASAARSAKRAPWYGRPIAWIIAGLIVLTLLVVGLRRHRRDGDVPAAARGPLSDPDDVAATADAPDAGAAQDEGSLHQRVAEEPGDLGAYLALCRLYHAHGDAASFTATAATMRAHVTDPDDAAWREVVAMGGELAPQDPLFAAQTYVAAEPETTTADDDGIGAVAVPASVDETPTTTAPIADAEAVAATSAAHDGSEGRYEDDPVDTKLDLARAYLDLDDPANARAMLEEVIEEGSQVQKDEAKRLLADAAG